MTFFYDLNKKLADLAKKQELTESAQPAMAEASTGDYSAKKARAGKDIGKPGKMFSKIAKSAGERYGSKERGEKVAGAVLAKLRKTNEADMEEGNEFSGELAKAKTAGAKSFRVDGKEYPVKEDAKPDYIDLDKDGNRKETMKKAAMDAKKKKMHEADLVGLEEKVKEPRSKGTAFDPDVAKSMSATDKHPRYDVKDTGYSTRYTRKVQDEPKDDAEVSTEPKKKGRPKGPAKGPERVTKGSYKFKSGRPAKTQEDLDTDGVMMTRQSNMSSEGVDPADRGEYDREGDMAKEQMHTIMSAAKELHRILRDEENLPEWVQKKITLAKEYIDTARDYMLSQHAERSEEQPIAEKAVSQQQQKFMGMAHAMQKGDKIKGASKELKKVAKTMKKSDARDFAATKHAGLPKKVKSKEETDENAMSGAEVNDVKNPEPKSKGGMQFGKGIYEAFDKKYTQLLNEGMNITVNMSTDEQGEPRKSVTVTADGDDADKLAELLKMAGIHGQAAEACSTCGSTPCGCESLDENSPDWPTNTETSDNAFQYSGGLNKPKSTGQTTVPVVASQLRRQVSMEEGVKIERSLFNLYKNFKAK